MAKPLKLLVSYGKFISEGANAESNRLSDTVFRKEIWLLTGLCAFLHANEKSYLSN